MPTAKELREKRRVPGAEIKRLQEANLHTDASGNWTPEWVKANADYDALTRQIEAAERVEKVEADSKALDDWRAQLGRENRIGSDGGAALTRESYDRYRTKAMAAFFKAQMGAFLEDEEIEACRRLKFNPQSKEMICPLYSTADFRALQAVGRKGNRQDLVERTRGYKGQQYGASLSIGQGIKGGYLVPPETLVRELELNMLWYGGMRQVSETIRTETGERMSWPTADDTTNAGIQLGEAGAAMPSGGGTGVGVDPTFAKVYWDAYKFSSQAILVPYELIQDATFDMPRLIGEMFGIRLGRITNTKFTLGTGAATPMGLITKLISLGQDPTNTYSTAGSSGGYAKGYVKTITSGKIVFDDVVTLEHSVNPSYRRNPSYMCHDQVLLYFRTLKDGIGRPLWQENYREGQPDTLNGKPIQINQDMASTVASGNNVLTYGDHEFYKIRTVGMMRFYRLEERYRDTDQDGFIALIREDGNLLIAGNAPVKLLQVT